jgi:hypothetical protein
MEVLFGTPTYDKQVSVDFNQSCVQTAIALTARRIGMSQHIIAGNCFIDVARNEIVEHFLTHTSAESLIFVDADVGWDANVIPRMLSHKQLVVAGLVPKRASDDECCYHSNALTGVIEDGLFQSMEAPTAFMRIKREAFALIERPFFKIGESAEAFGEDIYFCRKWCDTGEFLWIDSDIQFSHRGSKVWKGNFYEHCLKSGALMH